MLGTPLSTVPAYMYADPTPPEQRRITVKAIVKNCTTGRWGMPAIQRDVVWTPEQAAELLRSMAQGLSAALMMGWIPEDDAQMNLRGAAAVAPEMLLIDGQQRSTALTAMLTTSGPPSWCVSTKSRKRFDDIRNKVKIDLLTGTIDTPGASAGPSWLTIPQFMNVTGTDLLSQLASLGIADPNAQLHLAGNLDMLRKRILDYGLSLEVCVGSAEQATRQFIAVNRSGTALSDEDILLAALTLKCPNFRTEFDDVVSELEVLELTREQLASSVLRSLMVHHSLAAGEPVRGRINEYTARVPAGDFSKLQSELRKVARAWEDLVLYLDERGVEASRLGSYNALVPLVVAVSRWGLLSCDDDRILALLLVGNRISRYQKHSTDAHAKDGKLLAEAQSGEEFVTGLTALFSEYALEKFDGMLTTSPDAVLRTTKRAMTKTAARTIEYVSLVERRGWSDPKTGETLSLRTNHSQWHHVLPENFAQKLADDTGVPRPLWVDSLANLMVVRSSTNRHYSDTAPEVALRAARQDSLDAQFFTDATRMRDLASAEEVVTARAATLAFELDWPLRLLGL